MSNSRWFEFSDSASQRWCITCCEQLQYTKKSSRLKWQGRSLICFYAPFLWWKQAKRINQTQAAAFGSEIWLVDSSTPIQTTGKLIKNYLGKVKEQLVLENWLITSELFVCPRCFGAPFLCRGHSALCCGGLWWRCLWDQWVVHHPLQLWLSNKEIISYLVAYTH